MNFCDQINDSEPKGLVMLRIATPHKQKKVVIALVDEIKIYCKFEVIIEIQISFRKWRCF